MYVRDLAFLVYITIVVVLKLDILAAAMSTKAVHFLMHL
jgi:hypothetical protein